MRLHCRRFLIFYCLFAMSDSEFVGDSMSLSSPTMLNASHGADLPFPSKLPLEIKKQSDNVKNLLIGRVQRVKPVYKCRKITLYVCASDSQGTFSNDNIIHYLCIVSTRRIHIF